MNRFYLLNMFTDGKRAQLSENLLQKETPLFETSINGRETLYEEVRTPETPQGSNGAVILRNYIRNPPVVLSEDQKLDQYQSTRPFTFTERKSTWQH